MDREGVTRAKVLSNTVKQKRKEKAGKWTVPIPKVRPVADDEMFRQMSSGKRKKKNWKRMITKVNIGVYISNTNSNIYRLSKSDHSFQLKR
jgi:ribosome biogenesis protein NSA2